jgi:hypothetical protein
MVRVPFGGDVAGPAATSQSPARLRCGVSRYAGDRRLGARSRAQRGPAFPGSDLGLAPVVVARAGAAMAVSNYRMRGRSGAVPDQASRTCEESVRLRSGGTTCRSGPRSRPARVGAAAMGARLAARRDLTVEVGAVVLGCSRWSGSSRDNGQEKAGSSGWGRRVGNPAPGRSGERPSRAVIRVHDRGQSHVTALARALLCGARRSPGQDPSERGKFVVRSTETAISDRSRAGDQRLWDGSRASAAPASAAATVAGCRARSAERGQGRAASSTATVAVRTRGRTRFG